jgi:hypothetical protein
MKRINLRRALIWAGVLVAVDVFLLNQGVISALVGLWMLFVSLPRAAFAKDLEQRRPRLVRVAIFVGAVLLVFGLNWANNQIARNRAETLIAAIKAFNQKNHRYPTTLDELAPGFIDHVPNAKYAYVSASFYYVSSPEHHSLFYMAFPPFGRPTYNFERNTWGYLD